MLGDKIRCIRKSRGLSLRELAVLTKLSKSTISDIENGKTNPTIESLNKLADALNVNVEDLINHRTDVQIDGLVGDMSLEGMILFCKNKIDNEPNEKQYHQLLLYLEELQELRRFKKRVLTAVNN